MTVELISVGTEILLGNIVNTNASFLAEKCAALGMSNYYQVSVGDNEERLSEVLKTALSRSEVVILTGGLGPTEDDLTKEVTAKVLNRRLVEDEKTKSRLNEYFKGRDKKDITENNWKQTLVIEDCLVVDNNNGTAPGLIAKTEDGKSVILLPGPPGEMVPMFEESIVPYLKGLSGNVLYSEMVKICGIGESKVETMIKDMIDSQTNPTIAPYAKNGEVHLRVTALAATEEEGKCITAPVVTELKKRFGVHIYTTEEKVTIEEAVVKLLAEYGLTLSTAESCSGGLLSGRLVNVSGASAVFEEGFITYSNTAKMKYLNVSEDTLKEFGAVSKETAEEMARGAAKASQSLAALSVTGIAGPEGGTDKKPVGLVYIGCFLDGKTETREYHFKGNRQKVREYTVISALDFLRTTILSTFEKEA
ncbi:competence/damage-inducible protein A [Anaerocolumna xylanovorans]|uniref:Putative competence-damage inducible protein n=1 Tax=Anaerocolumna xylanovorans DSM 12503 TaxID=1121345 RepID=A0A1M7Y2D4_9FIRM|nr:competence/damage-inducible protein A [Anaerocolumna xylanovorans]SHO46100.1 competence/damage-inducible protein cinA [Anaerocolumna xylanovorans DSM 12503]